MRRITADWTMKPAEDFDLPLKRLRRYLEDQGERSPWWRAMWETWDDT